MDYMLYGLKTCDSCKKAIKYLKDEGKIATFVDIREDADLPQKVPEWLSKGDVKTILNTRSTTWRGLSDDEKAQADGDGLAELLISNPTLIKRPVIEADGETYFGWNKEVQFSIG